MNKLNVLIADDHLIFTASLKKAYCKKFDITIANDGLVALNLLETSCFDIAIIDIHMPKMNGIELIRRIKPQKQKLKIIVLTALDTQEDVYPLFDMEVDSILIKTISQKDFEYAINEVMNSRPYFSDEILKVIESKRSIKIEDNTLKFSQRIQETLEIMCIYGESNKIIAKKMGIAETTVAEYIKKLQNDLNAKSKQEIISIAFKKGLVKIPPI